MNMFKSSHFKTYFNQTDSLVAAKIANDELVGILNRILEDPTYGATGQYAQGYRDAINQLRYELGLEVKEQKDKEE